MRPQGTSSSVSGVFGTVDASDARMRQLLLRAELETDSSHKARRAYRDVSRLAWLRCYSVIASQCKALHTAFNSVLM